MAFSRSRHPHCIKAMNEQEDYTESQSAAMVAANLISAARVMLQLDTEYTEYSAQYLMDNVGKEDVQGEMDQGRCEFTIENCLRYLADNVGNKKEERLRETDQRRAELTVKDCLQFALEKGIPKAGHWGHLGCTFKLPPFACNIPRVSLKGEVVETKNLLEALMMLKQQPVGARLHVFSPEFDRVGDGIYIGATGNRTNYVGLRNVIIAGVENMKGETVAHVKICYKKKTSFVNVSVCRMFLRVPHNGDDDSEVIEPTGLLVDFCVPRLSIN